MTVKVEAWTLPGAGTFEKKDFLVEFESLQVDFLNSGIGNGMALVNKHTKDRLIDSENNEASLLRVFKDGQNIQSFFTRSARSPYGSTSKVPVAGPTIHEAIDHGVILPQNYPSSDDPDYEYASEDVLINGNAEGEDAWDGDDFEEGPPAEDAWSIIQGESFTALSPGGFGVTSAWAETGTYSFRINPAGTYSGASRSVPCRPSSIINIYANVSTPLSGDFGAIPAIGVKIDKETGGAHYGIGQYWIDDQWILAEINNVPKGTGATSDDTWHPIHLKFITGSKQTSFEFGLMNTGGTDADNLLMDNVVVEGDGIGVEPWKPWLGTTLSRTQDEVHSGEWAFVFRVFDYTLTDYTQGVAQDMTTGANLNRRGTFNVWIRQDSGSPRQVAAIIRKGSGTWFGAHLIDLPSGVWTEFTVSRVITEDRFTVEIRDYETFYPGGSNGPEIYFDDAEFWWGLGERTAGHIVQDHFGYVKDRGLFTWLKTDGFDESVDSNGVPWPDPLEMWLWHGMSLYQMMEVFRQRGYEWDIVWNEAEETYELEFYYPYTMGGDLTSSGLKLHAVNMKMGDIVENDPIFTKWYGEGTDGTYAEAENAALLAGYGGREAWIDFPSAATEDDLGTRLTKASVDSERTKFSLVTKMGPEFNPGVTARCGSLVKVEMSGEVDEQQLRIARMVYTVSATGVEMTTINYGNEDYGEPPGGTTSLSTSVALNKLLRQFQKRMLDKIGSGEGEGPDKGMAHALIVSTSEPQSIIDKGDYTIPDSDSGEPLLAAVAILRNLKASGQWSLWFAGQFDFSDVDEVDLAEFWIRGLGYVNVFGPI